MIHDYYYTLSFCLYCYVFFIHRGERPRESVLPRNISFCQNFLENYLTVGHAENFHPNAGFFFTAVEHDIK